MLRSNTDYYPFGSSMPGRSYNSPDYRYGFNGMEKNERREFRRKNFKKKRLPPIVMLDSSDTSRLFCIFVILGIFITGNASGQSTDTLKEDGVTIVSTYHDNWLIERKSYQKNILLTHIKLSSTKDTVYAIHYDCISGTLIYRETFNIYDFEDDMAPFQELTETFIAKYLVEESIYDAESNLVKVSHYRPTYLRSKDEHAHVFDFIEEYKKGKLKIRVEYQFDQEGNLLEKKKVKHRGM